jgi:SAM-dependent methyltransferase
MAIRVTQVKAKSAGHIFRYHEPAKKYCRGIGIELGAAAHNPFGLDGAINIAPCDDSQIYYEAQIAMCGAYAEIDICAEAHKLPIESGSQDYLISSHVVEHLPNPIESFLEWNRVLKPGGIVLMIVPLPGAHPPDAGRPIVTVNELRLGYEAGYGVDNFPDKSVPMRGHYYVYTLTRMMEIISWANKAMGLNWEILFTEKRDSKVGNGFCVIARYGG